MDQSGRWVPDLEAIQFLARDVYATVVPDQYIASWIFSV